MQTEPYHYSIGKIMSKKAVDYNDEPVYYCKRCLSLKIMRMKGFDDICYCDKCGSTDIESAQIEEWQAMYNERYNKK